MRFFASALGFTAIALLASGCSTANMPWGSSAPPVPAVSSTGAPVGGTCNAQPAQALIGQNSTAKVVEDARVRAGAHMARVVRPGQLVTQEYDAQRLNLDIDPTGRITGARCG
ncbi:I78 family peptidase inhibitor [Paracidovorax anthurii]|uniref:Peptidase inhibitor I78 family protein n=1 Tax=Paracidovorax anthurii TaxID=78229 RepID=A0A328Z4H4_9BURK|nr:I78 family peptidase inhibitor [Paracidovorax anthurii]RAR81040.1 peptidase inhibitor I78 family protein [Paracidovorax anthurii]